ncbi:hypothetical protein EV122DRAFT_254450 [Schizophyllum commune]
MTPVRHHVVAEPQQLGTRFQLLPSALTPCFPCASSTDTKFIFQFHCVLVIRLPVGSRALAYRAITPTAVACLIIFLSTLSTRRVAAVASRRRAYRATVVLNISRDTRPVVDVVNSNARLSTKRATRFCTWIADVRMDAEKPPTSRTPSLCDVENTLGTCSPRNRDPPTAGGKREFLRANDATRGVLTASLSPGPCSAVSEPPEACARSLQ